MLSDPFNNTLRELLAPKGVAKWPFDPSSGLLIPQGGLLKNLGAPEIQNELPIWGAILDPGGFGFKPHPTEAKYFWESELRGRTRQLPVEHFRTPSSKPTVGSV